MNKTIEIFGGGTMNYVRTHLALGVPAFGRTARKLYTECFKRFPTMDVNLHLTKMADPLNSNIITNEQLRSAVEDVVDNPLTKIIFFNAAVTDFEGGIAEDGWVTSGKGAPRLNSNKEYKMQLTPTYKIVGDIRTAPSIHTPARKDIFLVAFKTTVGVSEQEMYLKGLNLVKTASCNLVLVNDIQTRVNMIVTPEEAAYHVTKDRDEALKNLVDMTWYRSHLTFTQSTVIDGKPIDWNSDEVPDSLRKIVNYCVKKNAYKPFKNATVGHFAHRLDDATFLTSIRKSNFNDLDKVGLVKVKTDGPDTVIAYGAKPSVGGQSQRTVFKDHPGYDTIVHFHCPLKENHPDDIPIRSQREVECGSHECGQNTSKGLEPFAYGQIKAVMLDQHGPNIVFNKNLHPEVVIDFIERNFDLEKKTGGYHL